MTTHKTTDQLKSDCEHGVGGARPIADGGPGSGPRPGIRSASSRTLEQPGASPSLPGGGWHPPGGGITGGQQTKMPGASWFKQMRGLGQNIDPASGNLREE